MKADYEHYKLHWEFFKSVNPKADERFFVELQINDTDKQIKQGLKEIDFANDSTNTIEGYTNNSKRMDFFFHKEYNEFLKAKLVELKAKENLKTLPILKNSIIVHYGCSDFNSNEHKVYWIGAISHTPNKSYFFENSNEIEVIEKFDKYIQSNKEKTFIHWSMNSPKFGFRAIENRYFTLTNNKIDLQPKNEIDLSEYLKDKYGINYIERQNGRLNNLAKLNGFSGIQSEVEVININDATNRLELIFSIVQAEIQGNLKTENNNLTPQQTEKPKPELNKIWLSEPKISVQNLLTLGIEKGIWNDEYQIITAKGSLYGTGKTMLGSLFIALKGFAVSENIDYKEAGKVFCSFFNIPINERTKEPYKAFSSGNEKLIRELKRAFNIK